MSRSVATPLVVVIAFFVSGNAHAATKPLYLDSLNNAGTRALTRVAPAGNTSTPWLWGFGVNPLTISYTSLLQLDTTLTAGATIPVDLWIERNNANGAARVVTVSLDYSGVSNGNIGTLANQPISITNSGGANRQRFTFNFSVPPATTLLAGTSIDLTITNVTGALNSRIRVHSQEPAASTMPYANVALESDTYINVDNFVFFDGAYAAGVEIPGSVPGTTVYARATVSDPFGAADISSASITFTAGPCTIASATMTEIVALTTASRKTFESQLINTSVAAGSTCTASVTAVEGNEIAPFTPVTDSEVADLVIGFPSLTILKGVTGTAKPGQTLTYNVVVSNSGNGFTNSVSLSDIMSRYSAFNLTALPPSAAPFTLSDGVPCGNASGISVGTPEYANNRPPTYAYVPGATGFDGAITAWRMDPMTGSMAPNSCFTLQYQAQVK